jgi:hypothetical protein
MLISLSAPAQAVSGTFAVRPDAFAGLQPLLLSEGVLRGSRDTRSPPAPQATRPGGDWEFGDGPPGTESRCLSGPARLPRTSSNVAIEADEEGQGAFAEQ